MIFEHILKLTFLNNPELIFRHIVKWFHLICGVSAFGISGMNPNILPPAMDK